MPDHRFMYPKVVPVAAGQSVTGPGVQNFAPENLRISLQPLRPAVPRPKTTTSL